MRDHLRCSTTADNNSTLYCRVLDVRYALLANLDTAFQHPRSLRLMALKPAPKGYSAAWQVLRNLQCVLTRPAPQDDEDHFWGHNNGLRSAYPGIFRCTNTRHTQFCVILQNPATTGPLTFSLENGIDCKEATACLQAFSMQCLRALIDALINIQLASQVHWLWATSMHASGYD